MVDLALRFLTDQLVFFVLPDQLLDFERRRALDVTPTIAPILHVVGHLNGILLRPGLGEFCAEQAFERRRTKLRITQTD
jgi:hypothetical protein